MVGAISRSFHVVTIEYHLVPSSVTKLGNPMRAFSLPRSYVCLTIGRIVGPAFDDQGSRVQQPFSVSLGYQWPSGATGNAGTGPSCDFQRPVFTRAPNLTTLKREEGFFSFLRFVLSHFCFFIPRRRPNEAPTSL